MVTAPSPNGKSPQGMPALSIAAQQIVNIFEGLPVETRTLFVPKCKEFFIDEPALPQAVVEKCPDLAEDIAELLGRGHLSPKKKLPDVPDVRHNGKITVLANPIVNGALESFHSAQSRRAADWNKGERIPTFMHIKDSGRGFVSLRPQGRGPEDDGQLTEDELAQVWAQLTGSGGEPRITSLNGDVLLILLAHAIGIPPDATGSRHITAEQILDYRERKKVTKAVPGRERRTAGHRTEKIEEIGAVMRQLNNTWVRIGVQIIDDTDSRGRKRRREYTHQSRLIAITGTITQKEITPESTSTQAIAWSFALGPWAEPFLEGANRYTAELVQQCLAYDPYHELWEKRIGEYFTMHLRINAQNGSTIRRQIGSLLNELSLPVDHDNPITTRKMFEKAMDQLCGMVISSWSYKDGDPQLKRYHWLASWLNLFVDVTAAPDTQSQYKQIAEKSETRRQRAEVLEAAQLAKQKQRKEKGK